MRNGSRLRMLAMAALWMAFVASQVCNATVIAYDDFESYTAGNSLNGGSGGTGWGGNWSTVGDHTTVQSKQLDDPNGNVDGGLQAARFQPTSDPGDVAAFIQRAIPSTSGTLYMSMLIRKEVFDLNDFLNFLVSNGATGNTQNGLSVGLRNSSGNPFFARVGSSSSGQTVNGSNCAADTDYLIVAKFWKDGSANYNRADLFIDPADENEPGSPDATATYASTGISQLSLFSVRNYQPETGDRVFIDELRFADSFADAVGYVAGPDSDPPTISSLSPTNNATGVSVGADLVATFDETIALTNGGTVMVINLDASTTNTMTIPDGQVSAAGNTLTIDLSDNLGYGTNYAVQISSNAVVDTATNFFGGITNNTTWAFTVSSEPADLQWDHNADGTASDGAGTWLGANQWLDGVTPTTWSADNNAVIGSGGAGGTIALGAVVAGTVVVDNFTGTYTLSGGSLEQSGGFTVGPNAGSEVQFSSGAYISGTGDVIADGCMIDLDAGDGTLNTYSGDTIITNGGRVKYERTLGDPAPNTNIRIHDGILSRYYQGDITRALGTAAGEMQVLGGESGFGGNSSAEIRINNSTSLEVQWDSTYFKPVVFILGSDNANGSTRFFNPLDLNGADRTISASKDHGNSPTASSFNNGYAEIVGTIRNTDGVNPAGLIKTGPGRLRFGSANTFDGGLTVSNGIVQFDLAASLPSTGAHSFKDGTELWVLLGGGDDFTAAASGAGSLGGLLTGTGPGSSTVSYSGNVNLVLWPSSSPNYLGPIPSEITDVWIFGSMTLSGTGSYSGSTTVGRRGQSAITVTLGASTALASGTPVQVDSSGASKLDMNGYNATIGLLTLGSNSGGSRGQVTNSAVGASTLTLTNGVFCDDHNNGNGGIYCDIVDLNGTTQTFSVRDGTQSADLYVSSVVQNGGLVFSALESGAGLQLVGACTYTNGTTVSAGTLTVSGSLGDSTMDISGGTVNGSGTLTFNIDDGTADQITMTGGTLNAAGLTVNVNAVGGDPASGDYTIVDATGGGTISGTFAGLTGYALAELDYGTADTVILRILPPATTMFIFE